MVTTIQWDEMNFLVLRRNQPDPEIKGTVGSFVDFGIKTLELPWDNNHPQTSCIPLGVFPMQWGWSNHFQGNYWHIDVPGRQGILIHKGNFLHEILGCILVGKRIQENSKTKEYEIVAGSSAPAYATLLANLSNRAPWSLRVESVCQ